MAERITLDKRRHPHLLPRTQRLLHVSETHAHLRDALKIGSKRRARTERALTRASRRFRKFFSGRM